MLVVTYACEHNHPWPASKNTHHHHHPSSTTTSVATANPTTSNATASVSEEEEEEEEEVEEKKPVVASTNQPQELVSEYKFPNLGEGPLVNEFGWFTDFEYTSCTMLESPILTDNDEMSMNFTMREEDEPLFADLGELPECSTVFRRGMVQREAEQQRHSLATTS